MKNVLFICAAVTATALLASHEYDFGNNVEPTTFGTSAKLAAAFENGATGAITKNQPKEVLFDVIRKTAAGTRVVSSEIEQTLLEEKDAIIGKGDAPALFKAALVMGALCVAGCLLQYFTTKERVHEEEVHEDKISIVETYKMLFKCKSWVWNMIYIMCYGVCLTLIMNAINYYAPRIFQMIFGEGSELASLVGTIGMGAINLVFTALAFLVIDRFGRRVLIIGGSAVMIAMHGLVAWQLSLSHPNAAIAVTGIFGFIAFFAISSGACIWVYISEVFPNVVRAKGQALGCFTHWFLCTLVSWFFPVVAERAGMYAFAFFAFMMALQLVWAVFFMPETKGGTIEDIEKRLGIV